MPLYLIYKNDTYLNDKNLYDIVDVTNELLEIKSNSIEEELKSNLYVHYINRYIQQQGYYVLNSIDFIYPNVNAVRNASLYLAIVDTNFNNTSDSLYIKLSNLITNILSRYRNDKINFLIN